jgi:hypothetical protein
MPRRHPTFFLTKKQAKSQEKKEASAAQAKHPARLSFRPHPPDQIAKHDFTIDLMQAIIIQSIYLRLYRFDNLISLQVTT